MALLCIVMLTVRLAGAHLHLCFDGSEAPASVHLADSGVHHSEPGMLLQHQDVDVSLVGELLSKHGKLALDLAALLGVALLLWDFFAGNRAESPLRDRGRFTTSPRRFTFPPLRGPPPNERPLMS